MGTFVSVSPAPRDKGDWRREGARIDIVVSIREVLHWNRNATFTLVAYTWIPADTKPEEASLHVASCTMIKLLVTDCKATATRLLEQWTTSEKNLAVPKDYPRHIYTRVADVSKAAAVDWLLDNGYPSAGELE